MGARCPLRPGPLTRILYLAGCTGVHSPISPGALHRDSAASILPDGDAQS